MIVVFFLAFRCCESWNYSQAVLDVSFEFMGLVLCTTPLKSVMDKYYEYKSFRFVVILYDYKLSGSEKS